mmetsp:Transcript_13346/g.38704  ORF Transcript_13346/g.38704 Transcript_13346/m.38704 type:complete len:235 (+) Transcript_13346:30-734(+)
MEPYMGRQAPKKLLVLSRSSDSIFISSSVHTPSPPPTPSPLTASIRASALVVASVLPLSPMNASASRILAICMTSVAETMALHTAEDTAGDEMMFVAMRSSGSFLRMLQKSPTAAVSKEARSTPAAAVTLTHASPGRSQSGGASSAADPTVNSIGGNEEATAELHTCLRAATTSSSAASGYSGYNDASSIDGASAEADGPRTSTASRGLSTACAVSSFPSAPASWSSIQASPSW